MYKKFFIAPKNWHFVWKNFKYTNKHEGRCARNGNNDVHK